MAETMHFEFIAQERIIYQDDVNMVLAPGASGILGILPRHAPLMTVIVPGELVVKKEGQPDRFYAVGGGFMEVRPNKVILLARSGEEAEEIDIERAREARQRAEELLAEGVADSEERRRSMEQALRRSRVRLKVAERRRKAPARGPIPRDMEE
ncbi:MAG: ATP synthase F1 subunit epsilon [Anaerolineae bacterium]|nr:ATP synthase F1 subunit epsilon [Anaerolineae bacterium]MCB9129574.1 ATP synthase F1 subunit epsilon [Anaerolineales bacterium]MCB0229079.1 ATP synthase F1 subunit epsilon [Anaerolineae bacterium]MCB0233439.1 ATP synthase F1 subunit epsilon [Anaerolineae bacterium]MCB0239503.1 ATP synthase F1 subunit epsilon [Anaerolineae bacterium]